jgi:hypothetical protein
VDELLALPSLGRYPVIINYGTMPTAFNMLAPNSMGFTDAREPSRPRLVEDVAAQRGQRLDVEALRKRIGDLSADLTAKKAASKSSKSSVSARALSVPHIPGCSR